MTNFEKDIVKLFSGKELQANNDVMWGKIAPQINKRYTGFTWRNFMKLLLSLTLVIAVIASAFNYFSSGLTMVLSPTELSANSIGQGSKMNIQLFDNNEQINNSNEPTNKSSSILSKEEEKRNDISVISTEKNKHLKKNNINEQLINETEAKQMDNKSTIINNDQISNTGNLKPKVYLFATKTQNRTKNIPSDEKVQILNEAYSNNITTTTITNNSKINTNHSLLTPIKTLGLQSLNKDAIPLDYKWKPKRKKHGCYDFSLRQWRSEIDVYIGPDWTKKYLEAKSTPYDLIVKARHSTEETLEAFSLGIQYNLRHRSGFYASIGLNYSQIDEKFSLNSLSNDTTFRNGTVIIIIDSTGNEIEQMGDKEIITTINWDKVTYNYYRFLSIPLTVGYGFPLFGFGIEPSIGIDINILFTKKGEILNSRSPIVATEYITSDHPQKADTYKTTAGFSGVAALKIVYPFSRRMDFFGEAYARYHLASITNDEYPIDQRYRTIGLRLGARFKF